MARRETQQVTVRADTSLPKRLKFYPGRLALSYRVRVDIVCAIRIDSCDSIKWPNSQAISFESVEQWFYGKPRRREFFEESMEFAS